MIDPTSIPGEEKAASLAKIIVPAAIFIAIAILPFVLKNRFYLSLINEMMIFGLLAMSLDVLLGYTGLLSFMHNAYLGIGAYIVGLFLIHVSPTSLWLACFVGVIATSLIALPVGWVQVRTGGLGFCPADAGIWDDVFYNRVEMVQPDRWGRRFDGSAQSGSPSVRMALG